MREIYKIIGQFETVQITSFLMLLRSGLSGDAHFDDDERFTTGTSDGINLDWVAVHEFGHSMGLEHSNVRESIMYPWYKGYFPNIELTKDDILGIQALYGKYITLEANLQAGRLVTKLSHYVAPETHKGFNPI